MGVEKFFFEILLLVVDVFLLDFEEFVLTLEFLFREFLVKKILFSLELGIKSKKFNFKKIREV